MKSLLMQVKSMITMCILARSREDDGWEMLLDTYMKVNAKGEERVSYVDSLVTYCLMGPRDGKSKRIGPAS
jgi:hypothetical protein